jgi:uncharacterized protein YceK
MNSWSLLDFAEMEWFQRHAPMNMPIITGSKTPSVQALPQKPCKRFAKLFLTYAALSLLLSTGTTGCGTIVSHAKGSQGRPPEVYGPWMGVQYDWWWLNTYASNEGDLTVKGAFIGPVYLLDIPVSGVFDFLMWPYDAIAESSQNETPPPRIQNRSIPDAKKL